ncbi:MAG: hypothetical protein OK439_01895 [Thaumarchaeota archaeon]|nr:hypothetical protein [Nitrososphaerota archaeon]
MIDEKYLYGEDSALLGEAISRLEGKDAFLEIGLGGGGNLLVAAEKFGFVVGTDIMTLTNLDSEVLSKAEVLVADKASCFRRGVFDVVVFNPPYLPSESIQDVTIDGGPRGVDVPIQFLTSALEVLKQDGKILVLLSSLGIIDDFLKLCSDHSLNVEKFAERELFFETLSVYLISRIGNGSGKIH